MQQIIREPANDNEHLSQPKKGKFVLTNAEIRLLLFYRSLSPEGKKYFAAHLAQFAKRCQRNKFKIIKH